jgi:hypothetical protein
MIAAPASVHQISPVRSAARNPKIGAKVSHTCRALGGRCMRGTGLRLGLLDVGMIRLPPA